MDGLTEAPSLKTFDDHLDATFAVEGEEGVELELTRVDTSHDVVDDWKRFTLYFEGADGLDGGIHRLSSDGLDAFDVSLSPKHSMDPPTADDSGPTTREYEAVFDRPEPGRVASTSDERPTAVSGASAAGPAPQLSVDPIMGGISMFAGSFAPVGTSRCAGQLVMISQQQALFSIIGNTYGGNGTTTFTLPDLRGRSPMGTGHGSGLSFRQLGQHGGAETTNMSVAQMPPHTHQSALELPVSDDTGEESSPAGNALAALPRGMDPIYATLSTAEEAMAVDGQLAPAGDGAPQNNMAPFLAITYVINVTGVYPQRP